MPKIECGTPFSMAMDGYLIRKGECGNAYSIATSGLSVLIEEQDDGSFKIRFKDPRPILMLGSYEEGVNYDTQQIIKTEDEEIMYLISVFLTYIENDGI